MTENATHLGRPEHEAHAELVQVLDERTTTPEGLRETWRPGESASYEYHCFESDESADADLWHHSHQPVTVLGRGVDEGMPGTLLTRAEAGCPNIYRVRFADGFEGDAFEDELLTGPQFYERPDPDRTP